MKWLGNKSLLLLSIGGTQTVLSLVNASDGGRKNVIESGPILQSLSVHLRSERFAAVAHSATNITEVYAGKLNSSKLTRLTFSNPELESIRFAKQEVFEWQGADGWPMQGVLTYPLNYQQGRRYPLVLQIHGGPEGVSLNGWTTSPGYPVQVLAGRGVSGSAT